MTRRTGFHPDVHAGILIRDGGLCAMLGADGCPGHAADEVQHRLNRGMGGSSDELVNSAANGAAIEHHCNWALEVVPEFAEDGRRRGVKLEQGADPTAVPMWSPWFRQWLVFPLAGLDDHGRPVTECQLTGITDETLDARRCDEWLNGGVA